jgi:flagellar basal-body rod protein FlgB
MQTRLDREVGFYEQGLKVRSQRQQVLATNIANADTPNYKAQDINFRTAMQSALSSDTKNAASQSGGLVTTQANHIGALSQGSAQVQARQQLQNSADGNTVDMDVEQSQFAENALQYETLVQMISGKFKKLNSVLQG